MRSISPVTRDMRRSGIREIMELAAGVPGCMHLEVGEPDFDTPSVVAAAGVEAIRAGFTRYAPNAGLPTLRDLIAAKYSLRWGRAVRRPDVVVTAGAVCALATAVFALVERGDEVLVPDPGWPNYVSMVQLAGGVPVYYPLRRATGFLPDLAEVARLVTPRTKAILINSPANPSGAVFPRSHIQGIVELAVAHDLYVVSDEVYEDFVYEGEHASAAQFDPDGRVIVVSGFSKSFAMTGWRLGYAIAAEAIAAQIVKLQEPLVSCASSIAQKAAEAGLRAPGRFTAEMRDAYAKRRQLLIQMLAGEGLLAAVPNGAFYALIDLTGDPGTADSAALARDLLARQQVAAAPGSTFGRQSEGLVRVSISVDPQILEEACRRMVHYRSSQAHQSDLASA